MGRCWRETYKSAERSISLGAALLLFVLSGVIGIGNGLRCGQLSEAGVTTIRPTIPRLSSMAACPGASVASSWSGSRRS